MAKKKWPSVAKSHREAVVKVLKDAAAELEPGERKVAFDLAIERLKPVKVSAERRSSGYTESTLSRKLALKETRDAALEELAKAVRDAAGLAGAHKSLGVSRRTFFRILSLDTDARARVDREVAKLSEPI